MKKIGIFGKMWLIGYTGAFIIQAMLPTPFDIIFAVPFMVISIVLGGKWEEMEKQ